MVRVPTTVNGEEVFETPASCDHTSMRASCTGSKIARRDRTPMAILPDVVWTYFCRAAAQTAIVGSNDRLPLHHGRHGYFEANEGPNSMLPELLGRDEFGSLTDAPR